MNKAQINILNKTALLSLSLLCTSAYSACAATGSLNFGAYNPFNSVATTTSGYINIHCDTLSTVTVQLSSGNSTNFSQRKLMKENNILQYNLYADSNFSTIWGDGTNNTYQYSGTVANTGVPVFGHIPAKQNVVSGIYNDVLSVMITF